MLKSMTGYGKGMAVQEGLSLSVEIRSVNHRFCDINVKSPRALAPFEAEVRKIVGERLRRGKIDLFVNFEAGEAAALQASLNRPLATALVKAAQELRDEFPVSGEIPLEWLASQKDLILIREAELDADRLRTGLFQALEGALTGMHAMRCTEGEATSLDLAQRLGALLGLLEKIELRAPALAGEWRQKLEARLEKLTPGLAVDPQRIAQEVALFADRCDISEELTRFRSHLAQLEKLFSLDEPVGRKMDFLVQELNREANTMGSKSNDADLTSLVVDIKAELEKIREQIQNVE